MNGDDKFLHCLQSSGCLCLPLHYVVIHVRLSPQNFQIAEQWSTAGREALSYIIHACLGVYCSLSLEWNFGRAPDYHDSQLKRDEGWGTTDEHLLRLLLP
ncbi:hypothetical protein Nepgr_011464 [Nepenthes gracilis]|uniref:Uncharacterized protein n=1 Tax=Nepenthes gracilis TaxID=150966 RepID=A0AAD3SEE4_NEPGR|nr:hypothetical protein Nepgr_011464 [Nepenthes gracilis]